VSAVPTTDLAHALDVQAITEVVHRNAFALDSHDWVTLRTCYTDDVVTSSRQVPRHGFGPFRDKVVQTLEPLSASQHLIGAVRVEVAGDRASSVSTFQAQHVMDDGAGGAQLIVAGRYVDEWIRVGSQWRIRQRDLVVVWTKGNPAVLAR
jgi:ketosteroid isomerase-like protein